MRQRVKRSRISTTKTWIECKIIVTFEISLKNLDQIVFNLNGKEFQPNRPVRDLSDFNSAFVLGTGIRNDFSKNLRRF